MPVRNVSINRSMGRHPFTTPSLAHHIVHPQDPRHSTRLRLLAIDSGRPIGELRRRTIRWCPNPPHVFSFGVTGEEELVVPPHPTALAQRAFRCVLKAVESPIELPNGDEPFWVNREETVEDHLVLSSELVQFEGVVVVITVVAGHSAIARLRRGITYAQYILYHQWMTSGRPPKNEPTKENRFSWSGEI